MKANYEILKKEDFIKNDSSFEKCKYSWEPISVEDSIQIVEEFRLVQKNSIHEIDKETTKRGYSVADEVDDFINELRKANVAYSKNTYHTRTPFVNITTHSISPHGSGKRFNVSEKEFNNKSSKNILVDEVDSGGVIELKDLYLRRSNNLKKCKNCASSLNPKTEDDINFKDGCSRCKQKDTKDMIKNILLGE